MPFSSPKPPKAPPPPAFAPVRADARSFISSGGQTSGALAPQSLISTGSTGLTSRENTKKRSLIGSA